MSNEETLCSTGTCLGVTFLQTKPSFIQASERGRKGRGIRLPYQLFMVLVKVSAIAESYASLLVR